MANTTVAHLRSHADLAVKSVDSSKVKDNSLTGFDISEATLGLPALPEIDEDATLANSGKVTVPTTATGDRITFSYQTGSGSYGTVHVDSVHRATDCQMQVQGLLIG